MEWEDFQRVSTITNLDGEKKGKQIMKIWEKGRGGVGVGERGVEGHEDDRGGKDEEESNKANARGAEVRSRGGCDGDNRMMDNVNGHMPRRSWQKYDDNPVK